MTKQYRPTRLYVKRHLLTGLRYFGKSTVQNITAYKGSGIYWRRHLKCHGEANVITEWVSDWFTDPDEISEFALAFSECFDIVNSEEWANQRTEDGLEGGDTFTNKSKEDQHLIVEKRMTTIDSMTEEEKAGHRKKNSDGVKLFIQTNPDKHLERSRKGTKNRKENGKPWHSEETKAKIKKNNKAGTPEVKAKLRKANLGKKNPEHSQRMKGNKNCLRYFIVTDPKGVEFNAAGFDELSLYCKQHNIPIGTLRQHIGSGPITTLRAAKPTSFMKSVIGYQIQEVTKLSHYENNGTMNAVSGEES